METEVMPRLKRRSRYADSFVFFEGAIVPYGDAYLPPMTHALHYGTGCFEGIRAYWSEAAGKLFTFRQPEHYDRMRNSAKILHMSLPLSTQQMCEITDELLDHPGYDALVRAHSRALASVANDIAVASHSAMRQ